MTAVKYHVGKFPPQKLDLELLLPLIGPASSALARYDGVLTAIPNAAVLLSPLTTQEAVLSSKIERTQATMGEVLEFEAGGRKIVPEGKREDINEVLNYRKAMRHAEKARPLWIWGFVECGGRIPGILRRSIYCGYGSIKPLPVAVFMFVDQIIEKMSHNRGCVSFVSHKSASILKSMR